MMKLFLTYCEKGVKSLVSANREKYLWEIYANLNEEGYTRVSQLAKSLQVSVPSASKMAKKLNEENLIQFQRYGIITLTEKGNEISKRLIQKHRILVHFFKVIGIEQEKIENEAKNVETYISSEVVEKLERFLMNYH